ncbi:MAG: DUF4365 domain-containing protein [Gemmataceae bacterium]
MKRMEGRDDIGSRGEFLFCAMIMNFCGRPLPYFRPRFLGEKARTLDYLVELVGPGDRTAFFFAQVRATRLGYTKRDHRLRVGLTAADLRRLRRVPAPTYLVGIDEIGEAGYILAVLEGTSGPMSSLPSGYPLDCGTLGRLHQEVESYWAGRDMTRRHSAFSA